jgi:CheY-like chemotaxis protein
MVEHISREQVLVAVVDEDPWTVRSVNGVLRDVGFRTLGFSSPLTALELLVPRRCDVVVTEQRMSELSGARLSALTRERLGDDRPGFVLLSRSVGALDPEDRALFDACVEKPFQVISLIGAIESAVLARPRRATARPRQATGARWLHGKTGSG